jgi:small-conductance mechanosensitive channel
MNEQVVFALLFELWRDIREPAFLWQVLALGMSLLLAWGLSRYGRQQEFVRSTAEHGALRTFSTGSIKRVAFPLLSLLLILIVRKLFKYWHLGPVSLFDLAVPLLLSMALVRAAIYVLRHALTAGSWLATSERFVATSIWLCLALYLTGLADPLIEMLEQVSFHVGKQKLDLWTLLNGLVTVVATVLLALWLSGVIERRLLASDALDSNVRVVLGRLVKAVLSVVALLLSLSIVGIDITALSVFSGALAVGLGLGLQKDRQQLRQRLHHPARPFDSHRQSGGARRATSGIVTQITARYTVLRTLAGTEVIIPNEYLVSNIVRNESFTDSRLRLQVSVQVAYGTDLEQAMRLMVEAARAQPRVLDDPAPQALLTAFADSGINLDLGFWIADPQEGTGGVRSAINLSIWRAFCAQGIEIPFPQREVRLIGGLPPVATAPAEPAASPAVPEVQPVA